MPRETLAQSNAIRVQVLAGLPALAQWEHFIKYTPCGCHCLLLVQAQAGLTGHPVVLDALEAAALLEGGLALHALLAVLRTNERGRVSGHSE